MFEFKHPNYYKKIKKENRLTNQDNYDKGIEDEKIQRLIQNAVLPVSGLANEIIRLPPPIPPSLI